MNQGKTPKFNDIDVYKLFTIYDIIRILPTPIKVGNKTKFQIHIGQKIMIQHHDFICPQILKR